MTRCFDLYPDRAALNRQQFQFRPSFAQAWAHAIDRLDDSRGMIIRMEPVQNQQAAYKFVATQIINNPFAGFARFKDNFHHPFQSCAMQFHQQLNQLASGDSRGWIANVVKLTYQVADPLYALLKVLLIFHDPPDNTRSESLNQVAKALSPCDWPSFNVVLSLLACW
jgi:hypothetical protein